MSVVDPDRSVVLLLDCMEGVAAGNLPEAGARAAFVDSVTTLLKQAEEATIPVVRVDVVFRQGHPEVASTNAYFSAVKNNNRLVEGSDSTGPMAELVDLVDGTPRVIKKRIGAFAGSDLEVVLRGLGRNHLVLAGLVTRGAVLSTACLAADQDYEVTVVADACADPDAAVHDLILSSVLPIRAAVVDAASLLGGTK